VPEAILFDPPFDRSPRHVEFSGEFSQEPVIDDIGHVTNVQSHLLYLLNDRTGIWPPALKRRPQSSAAAAICWKE
jgi:hypothetical protein